MAQKKKPSQKKRSKRRREARVRMRKERELKSWRVPSTHRGDEVFEDMRPLFSQYGDAPMQSDAAREELMKTILVSGSWADEPELQEIMIDPMLCTDTFAEVVRRADTDPRRAEQFSEEERMDIQAQMLEEGTQRLLTEELRQDILKGLDDVRLRLKRSGKHKEAAKAAAVQWFLNEEDFRPIWPMIGVLQAVVHRSLVVGFELDEVALEVLKSGGLEGGAVSLLEKLDQSSLDQKADALLKKMPGLQGFMQKQTGKIWEEGLSAVFEGELYLGLFGMEEVIGALNIFNELIGYNGEAGNTAIDLPSKKMSQEMGRTFVLQLDSYITELFTPERLDQLRARLGTLLEDPAYRKNFSPFILMLRECMKREGAEESEKRFLIRALLGEMQAVAKKVQSATASEPRAPAVSEVEP